MSSTPIVSTLFPGSAGGGEGPHAAGTCDCLGDFVLRTFIVACASALFLFVAPVVADDVPVVRIAVLAQLVNRPPALSNLDAPPDDSGLLGARLAAADNNTTGRFMKQRFELIEKLVPADRGAVAPLTHPPSPPF